jgi:UDP-N-acetylmuramyl tripeptide synthase
MINLILILAGKLLTRIIQILNLGNGSTWPGHIALGFNKNFIHEIVSRSGVKVILIAGTNGKTTTAKIIQTALVENGKQVFQNQSGANLRNGIASTLILNTNFVGQLHDNYAIFEIDENALPQILKEVTPDYLVLLNLFRDQLDRYGEVDSIARKWNESLSHLAKKTRLIFNADDPQIAFLGTNSKEAMYFGLNPSSVIPAKAEIQLNQDIKTKVKLEHAADSIYCPICGSRLNYSRIYYSHLGKWHCKKCGLRRPEKNLLSEFSFYPLKGTYNSYNTLAAVVVLKQIGLSDSSIEMGLKKFKPAFGRQEVVIYNNKRIQLFLSKNPTGFNESLRTIKKSGAKTVLLVLNDNIADGRDVSWIWDIDFVKFDTLLVAGERAYDMGLRIKYQDQNLNFKVYTSLKMAIEEGVENIKSDETLYILPTYTAMLAVRKILTGKGIL